MEITDNFGGGDEGQESAYRPIGNGYTGDPELVQEDRHGAIIDMREENRDEVLEDPGTGGVAISIIGGGGV